MDSISRISETSFRLGEEFRQPLRVEPVKFIFKCFEERGYTIRIVGGAVRDILMRRLPKDVDFATSARPHEIKTVCYCNHIRCVETGLQHGTMTLVINGSNYEVTTLRIDKETDGRHAVVEYTEDWQRDAERRDLTVNAMSISSDGILYDYFNGLQDLLHYRVKFVRDPAQRIKEDYLRILRYFRFYPKIAHSEASDESFDPVVLGIIKELAPNLSRISVERVWMELSQILTGKFAPSVVKVMNSLEIFKYCGFNDLDLSFDLYEKYYHAATHRENCRDVPKVRSCSLLAAFFSNAEESEKLCRKIKLSNDERSTCMFIIENRSNHKIVQGTPESLKHYKAVLVYNYSSGRQEYFLRCVVQLMLIEGATNEQILEIIEWKAPLFPVSGADLVPLCERKRIGFILERLKLKWIESEFTANREQLLQFYCNN